jgi:hypothetical protein
LGTYCEDQSNPGLVSITPHTPKLAPVRSLDFAAYGPIHTVIHSFIKHAHSQSIIHSSNTHTCIVSPIPQPEFLQPFLPACIFAHLLLPSLMSAFNLAFPHSFTQTHTASLLLPSLIHSSCVGRIHSSFPCRLCSADSSTHLFPPQAGCRSFAHLAHVTRP